MPLQSFDCFFFLVRGFLFFRSRVELSSYHHNAVTFLPTFRIRPFFRLKVAFNGNPVSYTHLEQGMLTVPLIDAMVREQRWICPIYSKEGNSAYHARGEDNQIVVPLKGQFKDGENFYSTLPVSYTHL